MNTSGYRCIDIDTDDRAKTEPILQALRRVVGEPALANALMRGRRNSPRLAVLFRAAEGTPKKRVVSNSTTREKVEVLGDGQQLVVDGIHPSGAAIKWWKDRAPWNTAASELPTITEARTHRISRRGESDPEPVWTGSRHRSGPDHALAPGTQRTSGRCGKPMATAGSNSSIPSANCAPSGGRPKCWSTHFQYHETQASGGPGYETWCAVGMALARSGVPEAEDLWVSFFQQAAEPDPESELRAKFRSFGPVGAITVGTLLG